MATSATRWSTRGESFEKYNCAVVCPCEGSVHGPLKATSDRGRVWPASRS